MLVKFLEFMRRHIERRRVIVIAGALAAVLTAPSLFIGYNADDHFLRMVMQGFPGMPELNELPGLVSVPFNMFAYADGRPEYNRAYIDHGLLPWWSYDRTVLRRCHPLVGLSLWVDYLCFGDHAWLAHLHSLFWYAVVAAAVAMLYRRLLTPAWVAGLAAILFAIDDAHGFAVGWIANRNAFMPVAPAALLLLVHDRWRRDGWTPGAIAAPLLLIIGLLISDSGITVCAYLAAYALFMDEGTWRARSMSLLPCASVGAAWLIIFQRFNFGIVSSGIYVDMGREPGEFLRHFPERAPQLLLAQLAIPNPALAFNQPRVSIALAVYAVVILTLIAWILWPLLRKDKVARFSALGMMLSVIPMCGVLPDKRLLFFPGIGGMALVALFFREFASRQDDLCATRARRIGAHILCACWIWIHCIQAPLLMPFDSVNISRFFVPGTRSDATAPRDAQLSGSDLVIVSAPSDAVESYLPVIRSSLRAPVPAHLWALNAGMNAVNVTRTDSRTLEVRPEDGFAPAPWGTLFRGPNQPMEAGYTVRLSGLTIHVLSVTPDGRAETVRFVFDKDVDDPSLRWITWIGKGYAPFTPPAVGETTRVDKIDSDWAI
ncbi:MAG: hypothetical protein HZB26_03675 [Candidatus Hydrogenedentes bacterium]|nr:hypothetical protein [Candidatus Hydrogenedentota bacterium]